MAEPDGKRILSKAVAEYNSAEIAQALTNSFEGYLTGPVDVSPEAYERRFRGENLDPFASRVYYQNATARAKCVGITLVARRGWTSRIAGMGVVPELRGQRLGERAVLEAVQQARARGDRKMILEVFEQNEPAVRLYEKLGFRTQRRLFGYHREPDTEGSAWLSGVLSELDPLEVARVVAREVEEDLPWMLAAETLSSAIYPVRAYHMDHQAYALIEEVGFATVLLSAFVVCKTERGKGLGTRLMKKLSAEFSGRNWLLPEVVPEALASEFLARHGWKRTRLNQLEMSLPLRADRKGETL